MTNKKITAIVFAVMATLLYAINMPFSKLLLNKVNPTTMSSLLYFGAGLGIFILSLFIKQNKNDSEQIIKKDLPYIIGMVILDILAPIFLMIGLKNSTSSSASLLNNFEIVCTSIIALVIFKECISKKLWFAIVLITCASFMLSIDNVESFTISWGSLFVLLATLCWGFENNCTRNLANKNIFTVVTIKGIFSGLGSLIVSIILQETMPNYIYIILGLILGFIAYGLSIFFYIKAQGIIGAAKTSAYYALAPFIGTILSFLILKEQLTKYYMIGLVIMIVGTIIVIKDTLTVNDKK